MKYANQAQAMSLGARAITADSPSGRADWIRTAERPHDSPTTISCWNQWSRLRHAIVGRADGGMAQAPEHGFPDRSPGPLPQSMVDAANEQLDNFAAILERRGVRVDRPVPVDFSQTVVTPEWKQESMFGCMPPRDVIITIGNEILEATMSHRSRWFEYLCYRPLIERYFREDPGMKWEAAPKPRLTSNSYKRDFLEGYWKLPQAERLKKVRDNDLLLTEAEPLFDAADICLFGKDLFVQLSMVTNRSGVRWLRKHFPGHRVHEITFEEELPFHIDATWIPLRPGLVLHNGERAADPDLVKFFKINDWQMAPAARPAKTQKTLPQFCFCSPWLSMNMLCLDAKTVCVEASETAQMEQLDKLGFEVVPVPFWEVAPFGGGLHCATADLHRDGCLEDYFPKRHGRF